MIARLSGLAAWSLIALAALATRCPGAAALFAVALTAAFAHALDLARHCDACARAATERRP